MAVAAATVEEEGRTFMCPTCERAGRGQSLMTGGGTHHLLLGGVSVAGSGAPSPKYSMPHQLPAAACRSAQHTPERDGAAEGLTLFLRISWL